MQALTVAVATAAIAVAAPQPSAAAPQPSGTTTQASAGAAPQPSGALLSLAAPGLGQFYAGNQVGGYVWLGVGTLAAAGTYQAIWSGHVPGDSPFTSAQGLFAIALGAGAWLAVGAASAVAAAVEIAQKYPPPARVQPVPGSQPQVAPTPRPFRRPRDE